MTQHVSRKELKTDEVRDTFLQGIKALASHQQATLYIVIAALVVVLGVFGWRAYAARETVKASAAFDSFDERFSGGRGYARNYSPAGCCDLQR